MISPLADGNMPTSLNHTVHTIFLLHSLIETSTTLLPFSRHSPSISLPSSPSLITVSEATAERVALSAVFHVLSSPSTSFLSTHFLVDLPS